MNLFTIVCLVSLGFAAESFSEWRELNGKVSVTTEPGGAKILAWQFDYGNDPAVLMRVADSAVKKAVAIAVTIRSDRDGLLFLRIDQRDRKVFTAHFEVTKKWRRVALSFAEFEPFGTTTGQIAPDLIDRIYLVDLNGSDGGQRGTRTIFQKDLVFSREPLTGSPQISRFPLLAFDVDGHVLDLEQFRARGTSAGQWCYLSDAQGAAVPMKIIEAQAMVNGEAVTVPTLLIESTAPAILEILYWPAGSTYNVRLKADGRGVGIQKALLRGVIPVNLELAWTRHRLLSAYSGGSKGSLAAPLNRIEKALKRAEAEPSLRIQAAMADRLLLEMLDLSREAVRSAAKSTLSSRLAPGPEVAIPTLQPGQLARGTRVTVELEEPAFRIGMGQSFGFVTKKKPPEIVDRYYAELRKEKFNMVTLPLYWDQIIDRNGEYTEWQDILRFNTLAKLDYSLHAHGFVQSGMPEDVRGLKGDAFLRAAKRHVNKVAGDFRQRYGDKIILWQAINEPASNTFGGTTIEPRVKLVSDLVGHMRQVIPGAMVVVNDYDWERGIEAGRSPSLRNITGTLPFYRELMKTTNRPDVLALQWYPGARVNRPEFRVDMAEPCMDLLETSLYWDRFIALGLPIIFTESNFPGSMKEEDRNGFAWGRWDARTQARAAEDTILLALSKPAILGWVWWSITDDEPWNSNGGLYTSDGKRKPVLETLSTVISKLREPQTLIVETEGKLPLPRMPGAWKIHPKGGISWTVVRDRSGNITLLKDESRSSSLVFRISSR